MYKREKERRNIRFERKKQQPSSLLFGWSNMGFSAQRVKLSPPPPTTHPPRPFRPTITSTMRRILKWDWITCDSKYQSAFKTLYIYKIKIFEIRIETLANNWRKPKLITKQQVYKKEKKSHNKNKQNKNETKHNKTNGQQQTNNHTGDIIEIKAIIQMIALMT